MDVSATQVIPKEKEMMYFYKKKKCIYNAKTK